MRSCTREYYVTFHQTLRKAGQTLEKFVVVPPHDVDLTVTYIPTMDFCQFFSFFSGCFGFWFGISFLSFDCKLTRLQEKQKNSRIASANEAQ